MRLALECTDVRPVEQVWTARGDQDFLKLSRLTTSPSLA